mmetsp:Transcript_40323/g.104568  ORF Transcript_40323/g.104568 Transcript_40323/m.104568 type:complete len:166 (-) Transcript_40323:3853-4350(-)
MRMPRQKNRYATCLLLVIDCSFFCWVSSYSFPFFVPLFSYLLSLLSVLPTPPRTSYLCTPFTFAHVFSCMRVRKTIEVSGEGLGEGKRYEVMYDDGLGKVMKAQRTEITVGPFEVVKEGSVHVKIVRTTSWWKRGLFIESFHRYPLLQEELSDEDSHFRATVKRL